MKLFLSAVMLLMVSSVSQAVTVCQSTACGRIVCNYGCVQRSVNGVCVENKCVGGKSSGFTLDETADAGEFEHQIQPSGARLSSEVKSQISNSYHCAAGQRCVISGIVNGHVVAEANSMVIITGIVNGNLYCRSCGYRVSGILNGSVIQR